MGLLAFFWGIPRESMNGSFLELTGIATYVRL